MLSFLAVFNGWIICGLFLMYWLLSALIYESPFMGSFLWNNRKIFPVNRLFIKQVPVLGCFECAIKVDCILKSALNTRVTGLDWKPKPRGLSYSLLWCCVRLKTCVAVLLCKHQNVRVCFLSLLSQQGKKFEAFFSPPGFVTKVEICLQNSWLSQGHAGQIQN